MSQSENEALEQTSAANKRVSKYQCPTEYVSIPNDSLGNALWDGDEQKELWLIKAPAHFDPKSFEDHKLPISGLKMVKSCGTAPQIYSVLSGGTAPSDLHLIVSKGKKHKLSLCSSGFSGLLNISESYGNCSENQAPVPIPSVPAPCIPADLKQRFQPFGSSIASHMEDEVTVVCPNAPKRTRQDPNEGETLKKKKKKKKDKRQEDSEGVFIKEEQTQMDCDQLGSHMEEEPMEEERRRKKKKIKKEKERQGEYMVDESLISKTEPLDPSYDYNDTPGKTKKKKKKTSRHE